MELTLAPSFEPIAQNYTALLCDAWGVIHNGVELMPGIEEALVSFRRNCGPVIILTNAPRPSSIIPAQLDRIGLSREAYDRVVTSGDATRASIIEHLPQPAFRLGPDKDDALFHDLDVEFTSLEEASFIVCTGLFNDKREEPEEYRDLLQRAAALKLPMICANPDIMVNWGGKLLYCAGALAQIYAELGGQVIFGGKPHRPIYDLATKTIEHVAGKTVPRDQILVIGDGVNTDIKGANDHGIDVVFIAGAGGIHQADLSIETLRKTLQEAGVHANACMEFLKW